MTLFEKMKLYYENDFVTKEALKKWVKVNELRPGKGLTKKEYKDITGETYK